MNRFSLAVLLLLAWWCGKSSAAEPAGFEQAALPFLQKHCFRCHDAQKQAGKFRVDTLDRDFVTLTSAQKWAELMTRVNAGEMPPADQPQPTPEEVGAVVDWISSRITEGEAARMAKRGPVAHYRLSRQEYANTVYDLLGVHYDPELPGAFNEEPRWHGFERIGSMLSLSPSHVNRYFTAAETILERAFPLQQPQPVEQVRDADAPHRKRMDELGVKERVRWAVWPRSSIGIGAGNDAGLYRIKIQLSGLQPPQGRAPHLAIWNDGLKRSVFDEDIIAPEKSPMVIELETFLSPGSGLSLMNDVPGPANEGHTISGNHQSIFISTSDTRLMIPWGRKLTTEDGHAIYPLLLVDWIKLEGPIVSAADWKKREGFVPPPPAAAPTPDLTETRACLHRFATKAWRRPATDAEVERYVNIVAGELAAGENFRAAYMAAMVGVLTSKNFYYLEEGSAETPRPTVNDWELASRLSYFLWGSMPDEELLASAQAGKLHEAETLRAQFARMTADPRLRRFTESFPQQWLQLYKVGMFPPDPRLYPDYDKWLERSMVLETVGYFKEVFQQNLSLREFLKSDWTMVNPRLALHYGLPDLAGSGLQRVTLRPEDHRGGLLTQAGVLSLTSDGTRHRPVHRGVWVSEAIFGKTPPPPPPNVEPLGTTPVNQPKATIRMQLAAHATNSTCAACHRRIDPLGFAFENFDAIGRWRTEEFVSAGQGANPPVNASGTLADGRAFHGPEEFKELLAADLDRFAEAFVESLATFALRRTMTMDDTAQLKAIAAASKQDDYRLRTVLEKFVLSDLFQKR